MQENEISRWPIILHSLNFCQNIKSFYQENSMLRIYTKPDINSQKLSVWPPRPPRPQPPPSTLSALGPRQTTGPFFVNSMQPPIMVGLHPRCATIRLVTTPPRVSPNYSRTFGTGEGSREAIALPDFCRNRS